MIDANQNTAPDARAGCCSGESAVRVAGGVRPARTRLQGSGSAQSAQARAEAKSAARRLATLDSGIAEAVELLRAGGVETFESCQGGKGHAFYEPTVRFHGQQSEGFRALAVAQQNGLRVSELRRYWSILDGEPVGPYWEMTLRSVQRR